MKSAHQPQSHLLTVMRRCFVLLLLMASFAVLPSAFAASPRPNILFIYAEDLG